jgi:serine/threonine-protein kinase
MTEPANLTRPTLTTEEWRRVFELYDGSVEGEVGGDEPEAIRTALAYLRNTRMRNAPETREFESVANSMASSVLGLSEPVSGATLGRYRLIEPIAQGGMGSVWRGERADGLVSQNVAIKLLGSLAISRQARARFIREGELLAKLNHPNIARLHDVGLTNDGQRFLVIELIDGEDITTFCWGKTREEMLAVFRQLLSAVAYSHSQLVLHRDIKPANVLVDRSGQVKLLDFGVAKLADDEGDDDGLTRSMGRALTERYAAPEQFVDDNVGTSADVFALGSLLVELLSGERIEWSHPKKEWVNASLAVTLKTSLANVPDDLRAIASKATSREPAERYTSVGEFDDDVARFLASEPVRARPASAWYRFTKFVRRHRGSFGAGVAAALAVVASLVFALVQLIEARKQEQIAQTEAAKAKEIAKFTTGLFTVLDPKVASNVDRSKLTAKEILDAGRQRIKTELHAQPEVRLELLGTLAEMYGRLELGSEFEALNNERIALAREHYGEHHPIVYEARSNDYWSDIYSGNFTRALGIIDELDASAQARGERGAPGDERAAIRMHGRAEALALSATESGEPLIARYRAAVRAFEDAKVVSPDHAAAVANLGRALVQVGDPRGSLEQYDRAFAMMEQVRASKSHTLNEGDVFLILRGRGRALQELRRFNEAESAFRAAIELSSKSSGPDHVLTKQLRGDLAWLLHLMNRREEAWREIAVVDATQSPQSVNINGLEQVRVHRARMLLSERKFSEARVQVNLAIERWRKAGTNPLRLRDAEKLLATIDAEAAAR